MIPRSARRARLVAAVVVACVGCSGAEDKPSAPPIVPGATVDNPVACDELRARGTKPAATGRFVIDGRPAGCFADGQVCPVGDAAPCDAGYGTAKCIDLWWVFECTGGSDAGDASVAQDTENDRVSGGDG